MKKMLNITVVVLSALLFLPAISTFAQTPKVPITYEGDTAETIARRIKWIEKAKEEKEIMWWTSTRPNDAAEIAAEFNKVYPFIKLKFWNSHTEDRRMKIQAEHAIGRLTADLCDVGGFENFAQYREIGLVEKFVNLVPGIDKIHPRRYSKHMDWMQHGNNMTAPMYNTNLVSAAEAPKNWEDLLDSKWKGHIGMTTDPKVWYVLALGEGGWGIEKTMDFLGKLRKQNLIWTKSHSSGFTLLIAGEFKILGEGYPRHIWSRQGAPVDWVRVNPVVMSGGTFFFTKNAPHPNAAKLYLEWVFSPQGAVVFERVTGYGVAEPGSGTRMAKAVEGLNLLYRDEEVIDKIAETNIVGKIYKALGVGQ